MEKHGEEIHVDTEEARAGSTPHFLRYVLIFSLALAIIALSAIWITGALTDDSPEGGDDASANAASRNGTPTEARPGTSKGREMADLERFVDGQRAIYPQALAELRAGTKRSHWMWFIFPQIAGLGRSETARHYAISGEAEAREYLAHPVLGPRLEECTGAMLAWAGKQSADAILGDIDALKFCSSMTLFEVAGGGECYSRALDAFCAGHRDALTLDLLGTGFDSPPR